MDSNKTEEKKEVKGVDTGGREDQRQDNLSLDVFEERE